MSLSTHRARLVNQLMDYHLQEDVRLRQMQEVKGRQLVENAKDTLQRSDMREEL